MEILINEIILIKENIIREHVRVIPSPNTADIVEVSGLSVNTAIAEKR